MAWTRTENENVCIAWGLVHNHPPVSGTGEDFWRAVSDRFHSMDGVTLGRGLDHLANRFSEIWDAIAYFVDLEHLIRIQRPMFITDAERSRAACKLYKSHEHKDFEFMSCMHVIESYMHCHRPGCGGLMKIHTGAGNRDDEKWFSFVKCSVQVCTSIEYLFPKLRETPTNDLGMICVRCFQHPCRDDCSLAWMHYRQNIYKTCMHCQNTPCPYNCASFCDNVSYFINEDKDPENED
ncbi:hypothetical protein FRX31_020383 [Thalictrum thalictroides]|uniref:Uncharacterized protein n=1 Tax=Thalictrum thalictroides TaxID=46969 RepID=A0A7J6VYU4_THATH|nr:hypothetical protein FRX31_020383 [Thalictrum thalictroides]